MNDAAGIVALEGECALVKFAGEGFARLNARRLVVNEDSLAVDDDGDRVVLHDDFLSPPFVVLCQIFGNVDDIIETAGFFPIGMGVVDLAFETGPGPIGSLVFGMEVDATV